MNANVLAVASALLAATGVATAQSTVIFTDVIDGTGSGGSYIKSVTTPGIVTTHVTFGAGERRLGDIKPGPGGSFIFGDGIFPPSGDPNSGSGQILRVDNLFTAPAVSRVDTGNRAWNPIGLRFDAASGQVLYLDNLAQGFFDGTVDRALRGVSITTGVNSRLMKERTAIPGVPDPTPAGRPWHEGGGYLVADPSGSGDYFVLSTTGGRFVGPPLGSPNRNVSSEIWRVSTNGTSDGTGTNVGTTFTELIDTAAAAFPRSTDAATNLNFTDFRGITAKPGTNQLFVTSTFYDSIFRIDLTPAGAFGSATMIATGIDGPEAIEYDPFTDTLVFAAVGSSRDLMRINLDGSGLTLLAANVHARGITIVPSPGGAVLGLASLGMLRRRRR
jgi:hypothetical protein